MRPATNKIYYNKNYIFYNISTKIQNDEIAIKFFNDLKTKPIAHIAIDLNINKSTIRDFINLNNKDFYDLILDVDFKKCKICKLYKTKDNFSIRKNKKSLKSKNTIYNCYCNICQKKYSKVRDKKYRENNKDKIKQYELANKDRINENRRKNKAKRRGSDPKFVISHSLRCRLRSALAGESKSASTLSLLGCSVEYLVQHLENQFTDGMSWDKMGKEIHIDHIIPLSSAKTEEEIYKLCHYKNLQPLWAIDNMKKGNKII